MQTKEALVKTGDAWLAAFLLGTSILVIVFSSSIQSIGLGDNLDPGPKAFPIGLSLLLALGGIIELWNFRGQRIAGTTRSKAYRAPRVVLSLLCFFLFYVLILPWLGFSISTLIMATLMMVLLGNSWKQSLILSLVLITLIYLLFVVMFKVPLPGGIMNLPF